MADKWDSMINGVVPVAAVFLFHPVVLGESYELVV